jgi:hypothetical protein
MDKGSVALVKLEYGHLTQQIKNLNQRDWVKACEHLGIWIADGGGKGSHVCGYKEINCDRSDSTMLVITIQRHLTPNIQTDKLKQLVAYGKESGKYTERDVWQALGILK